ncbi:MAG: Ppx/GppA family phosphatase [Kordiimonadaceae bacterium]|nr:Ppx/GppA family phosphatase [Kordiimonadaceae bacterium]
MFEAPANTKDYIAVIDIGSNSVRLVVFSGNQRIPDTIYNEKLMVGLGAEVGSEGKMGTEAMALAISTLKRYKSLCDQMGVSEIRAVATAAVRDAKNGKSFTKQVETECKIFLKVISGNTEARLSAMGVLSGEPNAEGITGDLGGGSLELARIRDGQVFDTVSLPVGPLRLISSFDNDRVAIKKFLRETFDAVPWLGEGDGNNLYLVGGAWRNIAKLLMQEKAHPLAVLQGFYSSRSEFSAYAKRLSKLSPKDMPFGKGLTTRRREVLPTSALVLTELIRAIRAKKIVASSYGLREGIIFDTLTETERAKDPFLTICHALANERCRFPEHARMIFEWTRPLFYKKTADPARRDRLQTAVCLLSDIAWRAHPDFQAEKAVETILYGNCVGLSHRDRAYVAVALNNAYGASVTAPHLAPMLPLLKIEDILEARTMGTAVRLAQKLSGGTVKALSVSELRVSRTKLYLGIPESFSDLTNEIVLRRLRSVGKLLGRSARLEFLPESQPEN